MAHTPGPWTVGTSKVTVILPDHSYSFSVGLGKEAEANARLIAAAPEMLEWLTGFVDGIKDLDHFTSDNDSDSIKELTENLRHIADHASALLARVEGNNG